MQQPFSHRLAQGAACATLLTGLGLTLGGLAATNALSRGWASNHLRPTHGAGVSSPDRLRSAAAAKLGTNLRRGPPLRRNEVGSADTDEVACLVAGKVVTQFDDRNGDGVPSQDDVVTIIFDACEDESGQVLDGVVLLTFRPAGPRPERGPDDPDGIQTSSKPSPLT